MDYSETLPTPLLPERPPMQIKNAPAIAHAVVKMNVAALHLRYQWYKADKQYKK